MINDIEIFKKLSKFQQWTLFKLCEVESPTQIITFDNLVRFACKTSIDSSFSEDKAKNDIYGLGTLKLIQNNPRLKPITSFQITTKGTILVRKILNMIDQWSKKPDLIKNLDDDELSDAVNQVLEGNPFNSKDDDPRKYKRFLDIALNNISLFIQLFDVVLKAIGM